MDASEAPVLSAAIVRGADSYSQLQLLPTYQSVLGQPVNLVSAQSIIHAIEALYIRDGLSAPELQLDVSQLQFGILGIDVFEARITDVSLTGDAGPYGRQLQALGDELRAIKPMRIRDIRDVARRLSALPGLTVSISSRRDAAVRNGSIIDIASRYRLLDTRWRVTNRGTRDVGPEFLIGQVGINGLMQRDLKLGLLFGLTADTDEFRGAGLQVDQSLMRSDTRAKLLAFRSWSNPTESPQNVDVDYLHDRVTAGVSHRWPNRTALEWTTTGTLELDDLVITSGGSELQTDRLRVADLTAQASWLPAESAQYVSLFSLRQGLSGLGSGVRTSGLPDPTRRSDFSTVRLQLIGLLRLNARWLWRTDILAQYSDDVLADRERFKIGGDRLGRGFEVPALAGDQGLGAKLELRRNLPQLGQRLGALSAYGSYDIGTTRTNDLNDSQSAATVAVGAGLEGKRWSGYLELARPLTHPDIDGRREAVLFFDVAASF